MIYEQKIRYFNRNGYYLSVMAVALFMLVLPMALTQRFVLRRADALFLLCDLILLLWIIFPFRSEFFRGLFTKEITARFFERQVVITGLGRKKTIDYSEVLKVQLTAYKTELLYIHDNEAREHLYGYRLRITAQRGIFELFTPMEMRTPNFFKMKGLPLGGSRVLAGTLPWMELPLKEDIKDLDMAVLGEALKTNGQSVARAHTGE